MNILKAIWKSDVIYFILIGYNLISGIVYKSVTDKVDSYSLAIFLLIVVVGKEIEKKMENIGASGSSTQTSIFKDQTVIKTIVNGKVISEEIYLHDAQAKKP